MGEIFLTSDTHFCHNKAFLYEPRGFSSVEEMNEAIVERWNKVVKTEDEVYHLGDFALNDIEAAIPYINRLNGTIRWILGNHDTDKKRGKIIEECPHVWEIGYAYVIKHGKQSIYLSHYPTLTANYDSGKHFSQNVINLHGHVHSKTPWINLRNPFMYDVGMDAHNCTPVHIDEVMTDIRQRWNDIGQLPVPVKLEDTYPYDNVLV